MSDTSAFKIKEGKYSTNTLVSLRDEGCVSDLIFPDEDGEAVKSDLLFLKASKMAVYRFKDFDSFYTEDCPSVKAKEIFDRNPYGKDKCFVDALISRGLLLACKVKEDAKEGEDKRVFYVRNYNSDKWELLPKDVNHKIQGDYIQRHIEERQKEAKSDPNRIPTLIAMTTAADNRDEVAFKKAVDTLPYEVKHHATYTQGFGKPTRYDAQISRAVNYFKGV